MSFDALAWACRQKTGKLPSKMALLCLANYANELGEAYPSTAAIAAFGDMNHKTATAALDRLEELKLISDTGNRRGKSGQIKVYRLHLESLPKTEASLKRKPPVSSAQATQKREVEATQKRVTDTINEPVSDPATIDDGSSLLSCMSEDVSPTEAKPEHFVEAWNALAQRVGKPQIRSLTPERRQKLKARLAEYSVDDFKLVLTSIERSAFLRAGRFLTFDWIIGKSNFLKVLEGNYNR